MLISSLLGTEHKEALAELLSAGLDLDLKGFVDNEVVSLIGVAIINNDENSLRALISRGVSVDQIGAEGLPPLHLAITHKRTRLVELLIEAGAPVNEAVETTFGEELTPINLAIESGDVEIVKVVLRAGADPRHADKFGQTAMKKAKVVGSSEIQRLLKEVPLKR
jgi:ankyrin repeat protein